MPEPQSSWADEIDETGDTTVTATLPPTSEKLVGDSEKIITSWKFNDDGKKVRKVLGFPASYLNFILTALCREMSRGEFTNF
jgi:hypothetical protein